MNDSLKTLGPRYKSIGLSTAPELIAKRIEIADSLIEKVDQPAALLLARQAFGLPVPSAELSWFLTPFQSADPTFGAEPDDVESRLLAAGVLRAVMETSHEADLAAALAISAGGLRGLRPMKADPDLPSVADSVLQRVQKRAVGPTPKVVLSKQEPLPLALIQTAGEENSFTAGSPHVVKALTLVNEQGAASDKKLAGVINALAAQLKEMQEQMDIHWWIVGGWSHDEKKPFDGLDIADAAIRAGKELSALTSLKGGPFSAPALLDLVISRGGRRSSDELKISDVARTSDLQWRKAWTSGVVQSSVGILCPLTLACAMAAEAQDAADWQPRFKREVGISATAKLPALVVAHQVLLESLLRRLAQ